MPGNVLKLASGKPPIGWLIIAGGIVAAWGWLMASQSLGATIMVKSPLGAFALYMGLVFLPLAGLAAMLGHLSHVRVLRAGENPLGWMGIGVAAGLAGLGLALFYSWLNGGVAQGAAAGTGIGMLLAGLALIGVQAGAEELLFRGWLQPALIERCGPAWGIALGAMIFALFHFAGGVRAPLSVVSLVMGGMVFGLLAYRSGGLCAPVAFHLAWNYSEIVLLGLFPNPGVGPFGALIDLDLLRSPLWGGNEEGLNNSIGTPLVLLAMALPMIAGWKAPPPAQG